MKGKLVKEQQRSAGLERSRAAFVAAWRGNRMRSGAARTIQRHFRARRMLQLLDRTRLNVKVSLAAPRQASRFITAGCHGSGYAIRPLARLSPGSKVAKNAWPAQRGVADRAWVLHVHTVDSVQLCCSGGYCA